MSYRSNRLVSLLLSASAASAKPKDLLSTWNELLGRYKGRFQEQFAHEVLISEHLRATILAGVAATGMGFVALHALFFNARPVSLIGDISPDGVVVGITAALLVFELVIRRVLGRRLKRSAPIPPGLRYLNAFGETSAVTIALFYVGQSSDDPVHALTLPAVMVYFLFIILSTLRLNAGISLFTGFVAAAQYLAFSLHTLSRAPDPANMEPLFLSRPFYAQQAMILFAGGIVAAFVARQIQRRVRRALETVEERDWILKVFGQHTAPAIVDELLRGAPDTASRRKQVCIMFLDIRGFTAFSEKRDPEDVVTYLNTFFDAMIDIVSRHHGIIHQLLGDGFMAIFGAPISHGNDVQHAVDAAMAMIEHVSAESIASQIPPTRIGIGLHAGEALTGIVGSAIHKEYKVTGDVVNVAARLEQLNKTFDSQLLVSEAVRSAVELKGHEAVDLGSVDVRGRAQPMHVYRLA